MPGVTVVRPPGVPHYKTGEEEELAQWKNYGLPIYRRILELDDHDFNLAIQKQYEDSGSHQKPNWRQQEHHQYFLSDDVKTRQKIRHLLLALEMVAMKLSLDYPILKRISLLLEAASDFEKGVLSGLGNKIKKTRLSLRNNVYLGTGTHGKPRPVGGSGVAKVVSNPSFPEHEFFEPGRLFRVIVRHNNLAFEDDAMLDGRVTCIKMVDENRPTSSSLDFILHTGKVAQFYNAQSFEEFVNAFKEGKNGLREWLLKKPVHLVGRIDNVRRDPKSFYDLRYHSHVTYKFTAKDGKSRLARMRLVPALDIEETGQLGPMEQESVWDFDRLGSDPREADYLRTEFRQRLARSALQYLLQIQLLDEEEFIAATPTDQFHTSIDELMYNPCQEWDSETSPWHDVSIVTLTTPLEEDYLAHVEFSLTNHVASVRPMEAESLRDFNSLSLAIKNFHGVPSKAEEREMGFYGTNTKTTTYEISVTTGKFPGAGTDADITIALTGPLGRTGNMALDKRFRDDFETGTTDKFVLTGPFVSDLLIVELEMKSHLYRAWYVEHVTVMDQTTHRTFSFPLRRWITTLEPMAIVRRAEAIPPHLESLPSLYMLRKQELQDRRKLYQWQTVPGLPSRVRFEKYEHLPREARFLSDKDADLTERYLRSLSNTGSGTVRSIFENWDIFSDCPKLLGNVLKDKSTMSRVLEDWSSDKEFGSQFLNGPHPVKIECLTSIPENFPVTNEMVRQYLEDDLEDAVEEGFLFLVSYPELQHLQSGTDYKGKYKRYFTAPMCLFYAKESGSLVPIAIQLGQGLCPKKTVTNRPTESREHKSGEEGKAKVVKVEEEEDEAVESLEKLGAEMNEFMRKSFEASDENDVFSREDTSEEKKALRIWTPRDVSVWDYIKMWVKEADAQIHQVVSRHLKTNLVMEVFAVATLRNLPSVHPVSKILEPHLRNILAVNALGRQSLYQEDGLFQKHLAVGGQCEELMREAYKSFSLNDLNLPKDLERRGVIDEENLPNYFYRDDGLRLWKVIHKFVRTILKLQYWSDDNVQADEEVQAWVQDIHLHGFPADENSCDHGVPSCFYTLGELSEFVTMIMFTASCQTTALSAGMLDYYGYIPNYPTMITSPPPTYLMQHDDIRKALPTRGKSAEIIASCHCLSKLGRDDVYLGEYPEVLVDDMPMKATIEAFQVELKYLEDSIQERNAGLRSPYQYLLPSRISSTISM